MRFDPRRLLVHSVISMMLRKGRIETVEEYVRVKEATPDPYEPPVGKPAAGLDIDEQDHDGMPVYRLKAQQKRSDACLVYFHGGSYIGQIVSAQWNLVMELARTSGSSAIVPICPVAPHETVLQTMARARAVIDAAIGEFGAENVSVMGDSSGGGVAVSAVQQMRDEGVPLPGQLILLAPWLDLTMTHPDQAKIQENDLMVRPDFLAAAGRVYAGDLPIDDWRVSPLNGSFAGMPPMYVFTGSHDVVATDSRELVSRVNAAGGQIEYVEARGMQHVYPIFPLLPEARRAKKRMAQLLATDNPVRPT